MNVCNLWCRTNWESLFKYKHLAFENHFYKNTLEIPEGAHGLKMLMFFSGFRTTSWTALLQTCWALLSSSLESKLSGVISPSSIYIKLQFIQGDETHVYNFSGSFILSLFLFNPFTHTKSCSEGNSWVCIWKCKYDTSSCVCVVPAADSWVWAAVIWPTSSLPPCAWEWVHLAPPCDCHADLRWDGGADGLYDRDRNETQPV